jgi:hypothetical protein
LEFKHPNKTIINKNVLQSLVKGVIADCNVKILFAIYNCLMLLTLAISGSIYAWLDEYLVTLDIRVTELLIMFYFKSKQWVIKPVRN